MGDLQLPGITLWLDREYNVARSQIELPGIGKIVLYRTSRAEATKAGGAATLDIGKAADIRLDRAIRRPHEAESILYGITYTGDDDPKATFVQDGRQQVRNLKGKTFELDVRAIRRPASAARQGVVPQEFLETSFFITCDDPRVRDLARKAVGNETDPWRKALRIERWVHENMKSYNPTVEFSTAAQVARGLEGDCRHYAVLTAAMCRAAGVPSRTAIGLIYVDKPAGPVMGFHMWTEVLVNGDWLGLDATLGRGGVGPAHLKITDHSWHNVQSLNPTLPVLRVLGKVSIRVLRVSPGE
jgi:transglutaminase-like putative cysteine protease